MVCCQTASVKFSLVMAFVLRIALKQLLDEWQSPEISWLGDYDHVILHWFGEIMSSVGSIVLLVTVLVLSCPIYATGRDQLLAREKKISSSFNVYHDQQESLLTRRIRQSNGIPTSNHTLTCHQCRSFEDGDQCIHLPTNSSIFNEPCGSHQTACMVIENKPFRIPSLLSLTNY